jgi:iron(III) transport system substrate-binding protein
MKLQKVCAVSLAGLMLFALTGCGGGDKKAAAPKDGGKKLVMYWGALDDWMAKDIAEFQKETGIKVEAVRMSSGETIGRIKAEKANPKASHLVWRPGGRPDSG